MIPCCRPVKSREDWQEPMADSPPVYHRLFALASGKLIMLRTRIRHCTWMHQCRVSHRQQIRHLRHWKRWITFPKAPVENREIREIREKKQLKIDVQGELEL